MVEENNGHRGFQISHHRRCVHAGNKGGGNVITTGPRTPASNLQHVSPGRLQHRLLVG